MENSPISETTATISTIAIANGHSNDKIVIIMGSTGTGKSRLSIDLATRYFKSSEIINSDIMQVYIGLDITTNKVTKQEQLGVPHHLFGMIDPTETVFTPSDYRKLASEIISDVKSHHAFPFIVGGSTSLIYSLVTKQYNPISNVLNRVDPDSNQDPTPNPFDLGLRYNCCFIWIDVELPVLNQYLSDRVDKMLDAGMFDELVNYFKSGEHKRVNQLGLGQAIGVPEFETYFKSFSDFQRLNGEDSDKVGTDQMEAYNEAVKRIKENTYQLAKKQVTRIMRLRDIGWDVKRIDATEVFRATVMADSDRTKVAKIWEKVVVEPSAKIINNFMNE